jgi:hypothetical protein
MRAGHAGVIGPLQHFGRFAQAAISLQIALRGSRISTESQNLPPSKY